MTPELRQECIEYLAADIRKRRTSARDRRLNIKILAALDVINVSRERLDLQEEIAARKEQGATERIGLSAIVKALAEQQAKEGPKVIEAQEQCQEDNAAESGDDASTAPGGDGAVDPGEDA